VLYEEHTVSAEKEEGGCKDNSQSNTSSRNPAADSALKPLSAKIIHIKERNFSMLKKDLILKNPLMGIGDSAEEMLPKSGFGAVLARAGVGKTSLLVQLALFNQLNGKNVLHVSLNEPVAKVSVWYDEVFRDIADQYGVKHVNRLWESILPHRFIMTFKASGFNVPQFEERISDLSDQDIFLPQMVIIDGLKFDTPIRDTLSELKSLATDRGMAIWFTVQTHRHETTPDGEFPVQLKDISDLLDIIIQLNPVDEEVRLNVLKSIKPLKNDPNLILDPSTMLVKNK